MRGAARRNFKTVAVDSPILKFLLLFKLPAG